MNGLPLTVPPGERDLASRTLRRCPRVELAAREALAVLDPPDPRLLVVEQGVVLLTSAAGSRRPIVLAVVGPGAVLAPPARHEQVRALTDACVTVVPPAAYETLLSIPHVAKALLEGLLDALHNRQESLANTSRSTHADRLQETLFQLAREHGKVAADGVQIDLPLTHELLAQMVGSARETVTCALAGFRRDGLLVREGRVYRLTVPPDVLESADPGSWGQVRNHACDSKT
jgi:CRP/FNR family cyclic AMP-dependent transcriptional regulator